MSKHAFVDALHFLTARYPGLCVVLNRKDLINRLSMYIYIYTGTISFKHFQTTFFSILQNSKTPYTFSHWSYPFMPETLKSFSPVNTIYENTTEEDRVDDLLLRIVGTEFGTINEYAQTFETLNPDTPLCLEDAIPYIGALIKTNIKRAVLEGQHLSRIPGPVSIQKDWDHGWGNGYVGVSKGHPWWGHKVFTDVQVSGGITYADAHLPQQDKDCLSPLWWVGFDTGHWGDSLDKWPKSEVVKETQRLYLQACDALVKEVTYAQ